jgi:hypothetical protein
MNKTRISTIAAALGSALFLTACGGGGGGSDDPGRPGDPGGADTKPAITGVTYTTLATQLDMQEAKKKNFAYVNVVDSDEGTPDLQPTHLSGSINVETSEQGYVKVNFATSDDPSDQGVTNNGGGVKYMPEAHTDRPNSRVLIDETVQADQDGVNSNGHEFVKATHQIYSSQKWNTDSYVYVPAAQKGHVGMAVIAGEESEHYQARIGIFGRRTNADELRSQQGSATYGGVTHAYVGNAGTERQFGGYSGRAEATVDFGATQNAPTFSSVGNMTSDVDGQSQMSYRIYGEIDANGALDAQGATFNGDAVTDGHVNGALFGPDAGSMGYTYTLHGETPVNANGNLTMTGGAILNKTSP